MFKTILSIISLILVIHSPFGYSHGGGHEPINDQQAIKVASSLTKQFVQADAGLGFGKLDNSWISLPDTSKAIHTKGDGYYIVSLTNDSLNKALFVLMSASGEPYDANFTGEFEGLK